MSRSLERSYRRALRLLPGWYREQWEEDMVAAFMDSWLTGDPEADEYISEAAGPSCAEIASVACVAVRLYLGGAGAPRRYFAWGQAARNAVLTAMLLQAVVALDTFVRLTWTHRLFTWLPVAQPANAPPVPAGSIWPLMLYTDGAGCAWIAIFIFLVLGQYRAARVIAMPAIVPGLVSLLQVQLTGNPAPAFGPWAFWILLDLAPVLAMAAFHRDAPPASSRRWLLALPAGYLLVAVPVLALQATGRSAWLPGTSGLCCILVCLACLAHTPRARSLRFAGSGVWSLTLTLLAAIAGIYQVVSLGDHLHDPHLIVVNLAQLLILLVAVALVAPDAVRALSATPAPSPHLHPG
jgi:hypothetical protein